MKLKYTHKQLSDHFKELFPGQRGFSVQSVKRLCTEKDIKKTTVIDDLDLDSVVSEAVLQVYQLFIHTLVWPLTVTLVVDLIFSFVYLFI